MVEETTTKTDADSVTEENTEAEVPEVGQPEERVLDEENSPTNHQEEDNSAAPSSDSMDLDGVPIPDPSSPDFLTAVNNSVNDDASEGAGDFGDGDFGDGDIEEEEDSLAEEEPRAPLRILQIDSQPVTLKAMVESLLFVAEAPAEPKQFAEVLDVPVAEIEAVIQELTQSYIDQGSGLRVQTLNGRFAMVTMPVAAQAIEDFLNLDLNTKLSSAALETLAIVAYRQPVTRSQIEAIRGVDCGGVVRTLLQRELILEVGRLEAAGRPILYSVSPLFMQHFGLTGMNELPPLEMTDADLLWAATQLVDEGDLVDNHPQDGEPDGNEANESDAENDIDSVEPDSVEPDSVEETALIGDEALHPPLGADSDE